MFGAVQSGYDPDAIDSGLYRFTLVDISLPADMERQIKIMFRTSVNIPQLYQTLVDGTPIPSRALLVAHMFHRLDIATNRQTLAPQTLTERFGKLINHPAPCPPDRERDITQFLSSRAPALFRPYGYQFANVSWMADTEDGVTEGTWGIRGRRGVDRTQGVAIGYRDLGLLLDKKCFTVIAEDTQQEEETFWPLRGGMICDSAGLGKTVSVILLSAWKGPRMPDSATGLFQGHGGTLIVCPSQVVAQFREEIRRIMPEAKVAVISNKRQHERHTYEMLMDCHFVIFSDNFILNQSHRKLINGYSAERADAYDARCMEMGFQRLLRI